MSYNWKNGDLETLILIREKYKELKNVVKEVAKYVELERNQNYQNEWYSSIFVWSFKEAISYGFKASTQSNAKDIAYSLEEAKYKFTKYCNVDELRKIISE